MGIPVAPAVTPRSRTAVADAPSTDARMAVPAAPLVVNAKLSDAVSPTCAGPQPRRSRKLSSAASSTDATGKSLSTSHWYAVPVGSPMPSAARSGIFVCAAVVITSNAGLGIVASAGNRYTKLTPAPPPSLQVRDVVASTSAAPFTGSASCGAGSSDMLTLVEFPLMPFLKKNDDRDARSSALTPTPNVIPLTAGTVYVNVSARLPDSSQ